MVYRSTCVLTVVLEQVSNILHTYMKRLWSMWLIKCNIDNQNTVVIMSTEGWWLEICSMYIHAYFFFPRCPHVQKLKPMLEKMRLSYDVKYHTLSVLLKNDFHNSNCGFYAKSHFHVTTFFQGLLERGNTAGFGQSFQRYRG